MKIYFLFLFISTSILAQKKDVFFILNENHLEYVINNNLEKKIDVVSLIDRNELDELKKNPKESYGLEFQVLQKRRVKFNHSELNNLNFVSYSWVLKESWKPICKDCKVNFKNLYFLRKLKNDEYHMYKVRITITIN